MTYKLNLGRHQLTVFFGPKRGRPSESLPVKFRDFITLLIKIGKDKRRAGNRFSRVFRCVLENKKIRRVFGLNLTAFALLTSVISPSTSAFSGLPEAELTTLSANVVQLTTEKTTRIPLDSFQITQSYHFFHRAIDLKEMAGAPVYPIMDGTVKQTIQERFSYGNHVIIDHGAGFESLYAHLGKIVVKEGEAVDQNTVIGTVGSTGLSTGTHLHLEVHDHGQPFNPLLILSP